MLESYSQRLFADPISTAALIRRPLMEQAAGQWRRYALAFALMGSRRPAPRSAPTTATSSNRPRLNLRAKPWQKRGLATQA
jgi:hypothetical protein